MDKVNSCTTRMALNVLLSIAVGKPMEDPSLYSCAIGALQYLTHTRPDLSLSVNKQSQFLQCLTYAHWKCLKCIFCYLQGTIEAGLYLKASPLLSTSGPFLPLFGFSNAYWAACYDDCKSIGGHCVFLGESLVSWSSRKQQAVARSSTKSKYRSLYNLAAKVLWIRSLLNEINLPFPTACILWCDNLSTGSLANNPIFHACTKHIELDIHFIRDKIQLKK